METYVREAGIADVEFARSLYFQTMRTMIECLFGWDQRHQEESFASWFDLREAGIIVAGVSLLQLSFMQQSQLGAALTGCHFRRLHQHPL